MSARSRVTRPSPTRGSMRYSLGLRLRGRGARRAGVPGPAGDWWLLPGGEERLAERLPDKCTLRLAAGDADTHAGGGGWGTPPSKSEPVDLPSPSPSPTTAGSRSCELELPAQHRSAQGCETFGPPPTEPCGPRSDSPCCCRSPSSTCRSCRTRSTRRRSVQARGSCAPASPAPSSGRRSCGSWHGGRSGTGSTASRNATSQRKRGRRRRPTPAQWATRRQLEWRPSGRPRQGIPANGPGCWWATTP